MQNDRSLLIDNILLSGYLRESFPVHVPDLVSNLLHRYSREIRALQNRSADHKDTDDTLEWMLQNSMLRQIHSNHSELASSSIPSGTSACGPLARKQPAMTRDIASIRTTFCAHSSDQIVDIKAGCNHVLILTALGRVYAMGQNESGECGVGNGLNYVKKPAPIPFDEGRKITAISCGRLHSLFVDDGGQLLVCGYNYCGQLGIANHGAGAELSMSLGDEVDSDSGDVADDDDGDLGESIDGSLIIRTPTMNDYLRDAQVEVAQVYCGSYHSLCITRKGECYSFGHNGHGNLGKGSTTEWGEGEWTPHRLAMPKGDRFVGASCGAEHSMLLTAGNAVVVFGDNTHHQCSVSTRTSIVEPLVLSKEEEFGIPGSHFVDEVLCLENQSLIMVDVYKRIHGLFN